MYGDVIANSQIISCAIGPQREDDGEIQFFYTENIDDPTKESETKLVKQILDALRDYDIISAWNARSFDFPFLKQRQEYLGLMDYFDWSFYNEFDDLQLFKSTYSRDFKSYSLENVSKQFVGFEKVKFYLEDESIDKGQGKFYRNFKNNFEVFKKYNMNDVRLMQLIEAKAQNYKTKLVLTGMTGVDFMSTVHNSILNDFLYLRKAHQYNIVAERQPNKREKEQRKLQTNPGGGYTFCFLPGLYKKLVCFDYKSHYPLVIQTFNISPETYAGNKEVDYEEMKTFLSNEEIDLMFKSISLKAEHMKKNGELKASYDRAIDKYILEKGYKFDCNDVMWKFMRNYTGKSIEKFAKENNYVFSPADYNRDTNGWTLHPHRLFKKVKGIFPIISEEVLSERDKIKYEIKNRIKKDVNFSGSDEYFTLHHRQIAVKLVGNSQFGVLGAVHTRFFKYDIVDTVTTIGRWIIKKSIIFIQDKGYKVIFGDTDSVYMTLDFKDNEELEKKIEELNAEFYEYYKILFTPFNNFLNKEQKNPRTGEKEVLNHWCVFEHEHTYPALISVAKKRYYCLEEEHDDKGNVKQKIESHGGAFLKTDTNPLAAELQKELCKDFFTDKYIKEFWIDRITELKDKCFNQQLDVKYLTFSKKYSKPHSEFGGVMLDSETGQPKLDKDGNPRHAAVPVQIRMVKRLESEGKTYSVGDTIEFIIEEPKVEKVVKTYKNGKTKEVDVSDGKQNGISIEEYKSGKKKYDAETYWRRIVTPLIEILSVADKQSVFTDYKHCWLIS